MPATLRVDQGGTRSILGWLSLPSGATTDDPVNHIIVAGNFPVSANGTVPIWATDHSPQLYGTSLGTLSAAAGGRWLPAPPNQVAPDGLHYTYLHDDGTIRIADSIGGEVIVPNPHKLTPLAYTQVGIVLTSNEIASNGLWLLDTATHTISMVTAPAGNNDWRDLSNGTAWGADSPTGLGYAPPTKVIETTVPASGPPFIAYTAPAGDSIVVMAADQQGGLLVAVTGSTPGLVYLAPGNASSLIPPPAPVAVPAALVVVTLAQRHHADAHGIWFVGYSGVYLFTSGIGMRKIAAPVKTDIVPGGDCS